LQIFQNPINRLIANMFRHNNIVTGLLQRNISVTVQQGLNAPADLQSFNTAIRAT
jgi:hypothetical protein